MGSARIRSLVVDGIDYAREVVDLPSIARELCPCDDCPGARVCGAQLLACHAFALFVDGRGPAAWRDAPREASREIYSAIYAATDERPRLTDEEKRQRKRDYMRELMRRRRVANEGSSRAA